MGKIKVTKWVYEAFERERKKYESEEKFKEQMIKKIYLFSTLDSALAQYTEYFLTKCVILGYELEESQHDKVNKIFEFSKTQMQYNEDVWSSYQRGIIDTLNALEREIEGINR